MFRPEVKGDSMKKYLSIISIVFTLLLSLMFSNAFSAQFDASVPPKGSIYFKLFPEVFVTNVKFNDSGTAVSLPNVSAISIINTKIELYYSFTNAIMAGFMFPVDYIRESYTTNKNQESMDLINPWFIIQHQFLSKMICSASSIRIKIPIQEFNPIKEGFDIDDKQFDIYPIYYFDWQSTIGIYIYNQLGYKFRLKNDTIKPGNELKVLIETGYAIVPGIIRIFTCSEITRYFKGKIDEEIIKSGYVYSIGAGVRFMIGRNLRIEIVTKADPLGRNEFRGIGGHAGIGYVF